jgi:hypothetical protein
MPAHMRMRMNERNTFALGGSIGERIVRLRSRNIMVETIIMTINDEFFGLVKFMPPFIGDCALFFNILLFRKLGNMLFNSFLQTKINQLAKCIQPLARHAIITNTKVLKGHFSASSVSFQASIVKLVSDQCQPLFSAMCSPNSFSKRLFIRRILRLIW